MRSIFLYGFKLDHKTAEITHNINQAFGQCTLNERTMQHWFNKFRDGGESLKDEEDRSHPLVVNNHELRRLVEANLVNSTNC